MLAATIQAALWFSALGTGVMAGVYFAFSAFVMRSLAEASGVAGPAAMRAINRVIVRSAFLPLFFTTTAISAGAVVWAVLDGAAPGASLAGLGGAIYVLGMFVVTVACNVPRNERLDRAEPESDDEAKIWTAYLREWTMWNHVRTIASTVACALFIAAIAAR